jgi:hypothetical protein
MSIYKKRKDCKWSDKQDTFLIDYYYNCGAIYCQDQLKIFTIKQVVSRANRLGLKISPSINKERNRNKENLAHIINIQTPFIAYFLGFLWADGTISKKTSNIKLKIVNKDFEDIQDKVFELAESWRFRIDRDGNPNHQDQAVLEINHWEFRDFLAKYDYLIKSGASAKKILSIIPEKFKHYWWRGFLMEMVDLLFMVKREE